MEIIKKLFGIGCDHRFNANQVHDINCEPVCTKCNVYFTALTNGKPHKFVLAENETYKMKRIK